MKLVIYKSKLFYLLLLLVIVIAGCRKNLPDDALSLSKDTQFTKTVYEPVLGRNNLFNVSSALRSKSQMVWSRSKKMCFFMSDDFHKGSLMIF